MLDFKTTSILYNDLRQIKQKSDNEVRAHRTEILLHSVFYSDTIASVQLQMKLQIFSTRETQ